MLYFEDGDNDIHLMEFDNLHRGKLLYRNLDYMYTGVKGMILLHQREVYQKYSCGKNASIQNCLIKAKNDGNL